MKNIGYVILLLFGLSATPAMAQDDDLDVTMSVVEDENASEEQLVNEIELPLDASEQAHESASDGMDTANQARQQGSEFGEQRSEDARENGGSGDAGQVPETPAP